MSIPFTFPNSRENYEVAESVESIKRELKKDADPFSEWKDMFKVQTRMRGKYIYARCKFCAASLRYAKAEEEEEEEQQQQSYRLKFFNNYHNHDYEENVDRQLKKFIEDLPLSVELSTARKIAVSRFGITSSKFYHQYSNIKKSTSTITELIRELERRDYDVSLDPFPIPPNSLPRIIVVISPQMKKNFKLYGENLSVCYDLTYNLIQEVNEQKRQYAVGIFTGVNCYNKIIPFGITITCEETTPGFCKIFQTFIQSAGHPRTFITDEQASMGAAIKRLMDNEAFFGTHLIDSFHVIRNFSKIAESHQFARDLSTLIREESPALFDLQLQEFKKRLTTEKELKAFQLFYAKKNQVCFSQVPRKSVLIFNSSNSINEKMNDIIKTRIRSQKKYTQVLRILAQLGESMYQSSQDSLQLYDNKIEDLFHDPDLRLCRYLLAKRPMEEFLSQYIRSLSLKDPQQQRSLFIFREHFESFQCQYTDHFDCSCGYTVKTGVGCRHMIWICRQIRLNYMSTIHERWKFEKRPTVRTTHRFNRSTRRRK